MEIKGETTYFKASEMDWALNKFIRFSFYKNPEQKKLTQKLHQGRIDYAHSQTSKEYAPRELPLDGNVHDMMRMLSLFGSLRRDTANHAIDNEGDETDVIPVNLSRRERAYLLRAAIDGLEYANESLTIPEVFEAEQTIIKDDFAMFAATSDAMSPQEAIEIGEAVRDPEFQAKERASQDEEARETIAITAPMIKVLIAHASD